MSDKVMVLDIETVGALEGVMKEIQIDKIKVGNVKDPDKIKATVERKAAELDDRAALSPLTGQVAAVGIGTVNEDDSVTVQVFTQEGEGGEGELLKTVASVIHAADPRRIVTFNGRTFDIPFIAARSAILGLIPTWVWGLGYNHQYLDLFDLMGQQGSLEEWQVAIGAPRKDIPGSEIPKLVKEGQWQKVVDHCADDIKWTCDLYKRVALCVDLNARR